MFVSKVLTQPLPPSSTYTVCTNYKPLGKIFGLQYGMGAQAATWAKLQKK